MGGMGDSRGPRDTATSGDGNGSESPEDEAVATAKQKCRERAEEIRRQAGDLDRLAKAIREMRGEVDTLERTHTLTPVVDEHLDQAHAGVVADAREMREEADELEKAAEII